MFEDLIKNKISAKPAAHPLTVLLFKLNITDIVVIIFYLALSVTNVVFHEQVEQWQLLLLINFLVIFFIILMSYRDEPQNRFWSLLHYWYLAPLILLTFKELYLMIRPIRVDDFDYVLIAADRFIFGTDPTVALMKIATPLLTEILQIAYGTFYFLPIILGINLFVKRRQMALDLSLFLVVYGFLLSYIGYFFLPAIGPRFTLHDFYRLNDDLPGLFITGLLREIVNIGESIPKGTPNPAEIVQRDVFPSGHTQMTLITMYLAARLKVSSRYFIIPTGILLIIATVYLRYHYVIDLMGGTVFMIFTLWSGKYLFNLWQKIRGKEQFSYESN